VTKEEVDEVVTLVFAYSLTNPRLRTGSSSLSIINCIKIQ